MPTLIAAFLATLPLLVLVGNDDPATLPQSVWLQIAVLLLWIVRLSFHQPPSTGTVSVAFRPLAVFLAWSALSSLWAIDSFVSQQVLFRWIAAAGLAILIAEVIDSGARARRLLFALFAGSVVVSGIGLLQHLGGFDAIPQAYPPAGTMANKNVAAAFVAALSAVGAITFVTTNRTGLLASMALGSSLSFVLHTGCRAAWLALLVQLAVVALLSSFSSTRSPVFRWTPAKWLSLGGGVGLFAALAFTPPSASSTVQGGGNDLLAGAARPLLRLMTGEKAPIDLRSPESQSHGDRAERSVAVRLGIWRNTLEMSRSAPLGGVGLGNFAVHYPRFAGTAGEDGLRIDERVENPHNDFLQLVAELGLVGAILLGWVILSLGRVLVRVYRETTGLDRSVSLMAGLGLVAVFVGASVSPTATQPVALAAAGTFTGVIAALGRAHGVLSESGYATHSEIGRSRLARHLGLIGAAALLVIASFSSVAQLRADRHVLRMAYAEAQQDWPAVVHEGLMARHFNPRRAGPRFATASAMLRLGQTSRALETLRELTTVQPYNANAFGNMGLAYKRLGDLTAATQCFERVLALRPDDRIARSALVELRASGPVR